MKMLLRIAVPTAGLVGMACFSPAGEPGSALIPSDLAVRKREAETLRAELASASTPHERRQIVETWQKREAEGVRPVGPPVSSVRERWKREKIKLALDPKAHARIAEIEGHIREAEAFLASRNRILAATGVQKRQLIADLRDEYERRSAERRRVLEGKKPSLAKPSSEDVAKLPIEAQARVRESGARAQEAEQLRSTLAEALPRERRGLLEAWRQEQESRRRSATEEKSQ